MYSTNAPTPIPSSDPSIPSLNFVLSYSLTVYQAETRANRENGDSSLDDGERMEDQGQPTHLQLYETYPNPFFLDRAVSRMYEIIKLRFTLDTQLTQVEDKLRCVMLCRSFILGYRPQT